MIKWFAIVLLQIVDDPMKQINAYTNEIRDIQNEWTEN